MRRAARVERLLYEVIHALGNFELLITGVFS
jgi:hypothetical protein